jgi:hypothetical protein
MPPDLMDRGKAYAAADGKRLSHVASDLLQAWIKEQEAAK